MSLNCNSGAVWIIREVFIFLPCIFTPDNYYSIAYLNSWMSPSSVLHVTDFCPPVFVVLGNARFFTTTSVTSKYKNRRISRNDAIVRYPRRKWIIIEFYPLVFFISLYFIFIGAFWTPNNKRPAIICTESGILMFVFTIFNIWKGQSIPPWNYRIRI